MTRHKFFGLLSAFAVAATMTVACSQTYAGVTTAVKSKLAADDTVHLINRWRELRAADPGGDGVAAVATALVTARKAMVSSTLVLVAGFGWNRELGLLGAVVLLLALASDIVLGSAGLAVLARILDRRRGAADSPHGRHARLDTRPGPTRPAGGPGGLRPAGPPRRGAGVGR